MKLIAASSLDEYASAFWLHQSKKEGRAPGHYLQTIPHGITPLQHLKNEHPYKLPRPACSVVQIARLDRHDVAALLVADSLPIDRWMRQQGIVIMPYTRKIGELASQFLAQGFFTSPSNSAQWKNYVDWKMRKSLRDILVDDGLPLIQCTWPGQFEIVDGWGRMLAFEALLQENLEFHPVECFVAARDADASLI